MAISPLLTALLVLRIAGPGVLVLLVASLSFLRPSSHDHDHDNSPIVSVIISQKAPRRAVILSFLSLTAAAFFLDGVVVVARAVLTGTWEGSSQQWRLIEVADVLGLVAFAGLAALGTWKDVNGVEVWTHQRVKFFASLAWVVDVVQLVLLALSVSLVHKQPPANSRFGRLDVPNALHLALVTLRVLFLTVLVPAIYIPRISYVPVSRNVASEDADASTNLLVSSLSVSAVQYGTFASPQTPLNLTRTHTPTPSDNAPSSANPQVNLPPAEAPGPLKPNPRKEVSDDPSWSEFGQRLGRLAPYLWPSKDRGLQILAVVCILLLVIGRIVNLLIPLTLGKLVRVLERRAESSPGATPPSPWPSLLLYVALRFLQSPGGLTALRDTLWAPVMQYSDREMSQLSFDHLLNLSLAFHTRRKTGEILRILDRGAAINHILELLLFNIGPTFFDILIALVLLFYLFGWPLALVILVVMVAYVAASVVLTKWRTKIRRRMNDRDVITRGIHTDCLLNYETVKYFGGEQHEALRYQDAIRQYQAFEYRVMVSLNLLNLVQNLIFSLGILVGSLIVAMKITNGELNVDGEAMGSSDFVVFIIYLAQLYGPLNSLGYIYRSINQNLVDTERLMKLLDEPPEVNDKPDASALHVESGEIEFENVNFSYDGRTQALNGVSFKVPKNSSVALVGESGCGKSTVLRLLYRFYDLKDGEGRILIDGQDIREVTQHSLRKAIGVVPQDSVLFNASVGYNIGYGKFGATPGEIELAAQAAQMHERIMSFPDGYDTKVGERGIRLSGGEKQRVAIARTLLKNPPILLLDEATSALDTSTEKDIQKALQNLQKGRSSLSIAHRLSTIANADIILVLKEGQIVETGSFRELQAQNGIFASMWADQVSADDELLDRSSVQKETISGYTVERESKAEEAEPQPSVAQPLISEVASPEPQNPFADPIVIDFAEDVVPTESPRPLLIDLSEPLPDHTPRPHTPRPLLIGLSEPLPDHKAPEPSEPEAAQPEDPTPESYATEVAAPSVSGDNAGPTPFPSSEPTPAEPAPTPIAFPSSPQQETATSPGVTFGAGVDTPPRSGTPDPEGKPKRIRKTSQNIQKLARTLSFAARRQSSGTGSTVTKVETGSPRTSREDGSATRGEGSVGGDSTEASVGGDDKKEGKAKGKKSKKGRSGTAK